MNIKHIFQIILCACTLLPAQAQKAQDILDKTAAKLKNSGGIEAVFEATAFKGTKETGSAGGTIKVKGNKFKIESNSLTTWFDGKTQWTMQEGDYEVSMTEPTGVELQTINPYAFLEIYKRGFNYRMKKGTLSNGSTGYKLFLTADNSKQDIREIFLEVDSRHNPVRVSIRQGKNQWVRIVVNSFRVSKSFADGHFTFPKAKYPNVEIIDLR